MDYRDISSGKRHSLHFHQSSPRASPSLGPPVLDHTTARILYVYIDGMTLRHITIADDQFKTKLLYTIEHNSGGTLSSPPRLTIAKCQSTANPNEAVIGTATLQGGAIDFVSHGHSVSMDRNSFFGHSYAFMSPAFRQRLFWETEGIWGVDLVLVNGQREWIAKFDASLFSTSNAGRLHISNKAMSEAALDEIVISGCGFLQNERRKRSRTSAGGGAASGGAY
ncbi:MAG: hypothetical protein Q9169_001808 [Polycauliona sp. 2 TL-2023]